MSDEHVKDLSDFIPKVLNDEWETREVKQVNLTSCKECIFAIKDGNTQTGCELGRLEKFRKKEIDVVEAHDGEAEFYGLLTWCNAYRREPWSIANKDEDLVALVKSETAPNVNFIILVNKTMDGLENTIDSILKQKQISACRILVAHMGKEEDVPYVDLIEKCKDLIGDSVGFKVQNQIPSLSQREAIDEAFSALLAGYYTVLECGKEAPEDLLKVIQDSLHEDMKNVGFIEGYDGINGLTVQCVLHKFLYGNKGADIEVKLKEGEEYDETLPQNSLLHTWDDLR